MTINNIEINRIDFLFIQGSFKYVLKNSGFAREDKSGINFYPLSTQPLRYSLVRNAFAAGSFVTTPATGSYCNSLPA